MPIISKVGARSLKVRLAYGAIVGVLVLGSVTMVYPFLLMLSGSVKSEADSVQFTPYPNFWFDDVGLFQKYVESKHNVDLTLAEAAWGQPIGSWRNIGRPADSNLLEDFIEWRKTCPWWWMGHSNGGKMLPINARLFREGMSRRYHGDIERFGNDMGVPWDSWNGVLPPPPNPFRYPQEKEGLVGAFREFAQTRPDKDRVLINLDGDFWKKFLVQRYTEGVAEYNKRHESNYASYQDIFLSPRVPSPPAQRKDWEEYVREAMPLEFIRLGGEGNEPYHRFLAGKYGNVGEYNRHHEPNVASFSQVALPRSIPAKRADQVDWKDFLQDPNLCPAETIEIHGPRQSFEAFVAKRRNVPVAQVAPLPMPIAAADWRDCMANSHDERMEFTTRNYKHVLGYILLHGRGVLNTIIFCGLAILTALVVNPIAAYALSRYKPPSTYKILLFCMTTMAFPGEVTMIPSFLLLKRFPLWPLVGGGAAFVAGIWLLRRLLPKAPDLLRLTLALGIGVLAGVWAIPAATGRPYVSLLNTFAALVLPGMANGYAIFLLKGFFDSLPKELYEAADLDGASEWLKFWTFTMALSKPILAVIALGAFTGAYSAFMMALIIIPDPNMWTLMVWIFQLQGQSHQSVVYASLVLAAIPVLFVFIICQGFIIKGIVVPVEK